MKKVYSLFVAVLLLMASGGLYAQQSIGGVTPTRPHFYSVLELISQYKNGVYGGLRLPQMTTSQRDGLGIPALTGGAKDSAQGLTVFNTTINCVEYWNGTQWNSLCGMSSSDIVKIIKDNTTNWYNSNTVLQDSIFQTVKAKGDSLTTTKFLTVNGVNRLDSSVLKAAKLDVNVKVLASDSLFISTEVSSKQFKDSITKVVNANAWLLKGNAGTTPGTNFIGTTDAVNLQVKTNNLTRMTITSAGNVGIGAVPNNSSILDMGSVNNKALTVPMVPLINATDVTTVNAPTKGMVVYNTNTNMLNMFDGTQWNALVTTIPNVVTSKLMAVATSVNTNTTYTGGNIWFDTEMYDPENALVLGSSTANPATYTVTKAALHQIFLNFSNNAITNTGTFYLRIKKNGTVIAAIDATAAAGASACLFAIENFAVGDKITVDKGGNNTGWSGSLNRLSIFRFD